MKLQCLIGALICYLEQKNEKNLKIKQLMNFRFPWIWNEWEKLRHASFWAFELYSFDTYLHFVHV